MQSFMFSFSTFFELGSIHEMDQVLNPRMQPIKFPFLAHRCKKKTREYDLNDKLLPVDLDFTYQPRC